MASSTGFTPSNDINPKVRKATKEASKKVKEDYLAVDPPVPGQNFVCLSFVSPENALKERYLWYFQKFLQWTCQPVDRSVLAPDTPDLPRSRLHEFIQQNKEVKFDEVKDLWDDFMFQQHEPLAQKYDEENEYQTSIRGVKIRGSYSSYKEAQHRAQQLSKSDDSFHVFVGQVGYWLPWDPNANYMEEQEYQNAELNALVKKYKENKESRDAFYEERRREKIRKATEDNQRRKEENKEDVSATADASAAPPPPTTTTVSEAETKKNIDRLRDISLEKNRVFQEAQDAKKKMEQEAKELANEAKKFEPIAEEQTAVVEEKKTEENKVDQSVFTNEDPWLQRKREQL